MSKIWAKVVGYFRSGTQVGIDKAGNKYFTRLEDIDGAMKEKRWVIFKGDDDPTLVPVEWICWLNGQRKKVPTPEESIRKFMMEEMMELEARRERVRLNVALMKKEEEEERKSKINELQKTTSDVKSGCPDLKSFIQQFPDVSTSQKRGTVSEGTADKNDDIADEIRSSEPTGSGQSFKPGTWQPPT